MAGETINGVPVTDGLIQDWADEAEAGYDVEKLRKRGRPAMGDGPGVVVPVRMDAALLEALTRPVVERVERAGRGGPRYRPECHTPLVACMP